jgi:hypothetical protein
MHIKNINSGFFMTFAYKCLARQMYIFTDKYGEAYVFKQDLYIGSQAKQLSRFTSNGFANYFIFSN